MTWKEFKEWAESKGVEDDDNIEWIDFHEPREINRVKGKDGEWFIDIS